MNATLNLIGFLILFKVTAFSRALGWHNMELLISEFQDRLHFGISHELLDLMHLDSLNGVRARALFNAGVETVAQLANLDILSLENILHRAIPFESNQNNDNKKKNVKSIWVTGKDAMSEREAAEILLREARTYLELEIGLVDVKWASDKGIGNIDIEDATIKNSNQSKTSYVSLHNLDATGMVKPTPEIVCTELNHPNQDFSVQNIEGELYVTMNSIAANSNLDLNSKCQSLLNMESKHQENQSDQNRDEVKISMLEISSTEIKSQKKDFSSQQNIDWDLNVSSKMADDCDLNVNFDKSLCIESNLQLAETNEGEDKSIILDFDLNVEFERSLCIESEDQNAETDQVEDKSVILDFDLDVEFDRSLFIESEHPRADMDEEKRKSVCHNLDLSVNFDTSLCTEPKHQKTNAGDYSIRSNFDRNVEFEHQKSEIDEREKSISYNFDLDVDFDSSVCDQKAEEVNEPVSRNLDLNMKFDSSLRFESIHQNAEMDEAEKSVSYLSKIIY